MNIRHRNRDLRVALPGMLCMALMAGCERTGQSTESAVGQPEGDQGAADERPLGQVTEFDGFTLRANLSRTEFLPDDMARKYGIDPALNLALLNLVILEKRPDQQSVTVPAEVKVQYENLVGHSEVIDMRAVEEDGYVSYIGTLDASTHRVYRLAIEAMPAGADEPLRMNFEVQLETLDIT